MDFGIPKNSQIMGYRLYSVSYLLLLCIYFYIAISEQTTKPWTTAHLLDFNGYRGYNVSIVAADATATTYFLACTPTVPGYSGNCNNDGMTVNITAIQGPSTAGMIIIDTRASASWEYRCPVTDFSIKSCTYTESSILPSGSSDTQGLGSGFEGETVVVGPTTFTNAMVVTDDVTEITTVVVYITDGVEKLATPSGSDATVTGNTSGFGSSRSSSSRDATGGMLCSVETFELRKMLMIYSIKFLVNSSYSDIRCCPERRDTEPDFSPQSRSRTDCSSWKWSNARWACRYAHCRFLKILAVTGQHLDDERVFRRFNFALRRFSVYRYATPQS